MANKCPKTKTKEYWLLQSIKTRCTDYNDGRNTVYLEKNIKVCQRWLGPSGYDNFVLDMGRRPSDKHQIDRIDNSKGYSKTNCRWVTKSQQMMNKGPIKNKKYSKFKGVHYKSDGYRKKRWSAIITANKVKYNIGIFATEKEAALAYNNKAKILHGEFASLNILKG